MHLPKLPRPSSRRMALLALALAGAALVLPALPTPAREGLVIPAPAIDMPAPAGGGTQVAVLAGGCFWGIQGVFQHVEGVVSAVSGYAGGKAATAHYDEVGSGDTGHAESVQITYDPNKISYGKLLQVFFSAAHDPTQLNRQGPDEGTQYRTAIFPQDEEQGRIARAYIAQLDQAHVFAAPIATKVEPGQSFYRAETYHQDYLTLHPTQPYIVFNDLPKIENLKRLFRSLSRQAGAGVAGWRRRRRGQTILRMKASGEVAMILRLNISLPPKQFYATIDAVECKLAWYDSQIAACTDDDALADFGNDRALLQTVRSYLKEEMGKWNAALDKDRSSPAKS